MEERQNITPVEGNNIILSIIIPIYNTSVQYFQECLASIDRANIKFPYEIIVVNDGSTNADIIHFLENYKNPHTKIFHKKNEGPSSARNEGFKHIKGELVLCLDSDDILLPEINEAIIYLLKNPDYDVIYSDIIAFGNENYKITKGNFSKFKLMYIGHITSASNLFRREILKKVDHFNEDIVYAEDWDFWARVASAGFRFKYLPQPFFKYRKHTIGQSLSKQNYDKREEIFSFIKSQFNPHQEITLQEVNQYILNNFRDNKKHIIKLLLILFLPSLFKFLNKKGFYKNNIVID